MPIRSRAAAKPEPRKATTTSKARTSADAPKARPARARSASPLARLRATCLALPETGEKEAWGTPTFRVRDKMFVMYVDDHHGDGRTAMWCKAAMGTQEMLVESDPERFFVPPYVGVKGWVGMCLDGGADWAEVAEIVRDAWRMAAPKKLLAALGEG